MRIALLSPRGPLYRHRGGIFKKSLRYMPLTLTTLAALVPPELGAEVQLVDEGSQEIDLSLSADLIGISAITGTAPRAYELADHFRRRGIPVVLGGVHPTLMPDEAARHADSVVTGYAEDSWPQLLRDFAGSRMEARYRQAADLSLADRPFPRRDLLARQSYFTPHTIEATRGCLHRCRFCVVPSAWGRPLSYPVEYVIEDIRRMRARKVIFLDLNLIANRDYARELFTAMIPLRLRWGGLATTLIARDSELLELAARSGCRGLLIGFETLNPAALKEARKAFNPHREYRQVVERIHAAGIAIMGTFVFGFDADESDTFEQVSQFVQEARIDLPRFAMLTPFPGTPLFSQLEAEGRILTRDWSLYDGQHCVFRPARMSPEQLQAGTERVWRSTYSWGSILRRVRPTRMLPTLLAANLGYRYYAHNLHRFYTCLEVAA